MRNIMLKLRLKASTELRTRALVSYILERLWQSLHQPTPSIAAMMTPTHLNIALLLRCPLLGSATAIALLLSAIASTAVQAQIEPDETLGNERSVVTEKAVVRGELTDLIEGGATRGDHLFHSLSEFNVDDGQRVYFANPAGIESIFSRITGNNPSNIFGTLGVDGSANLFLMNPNGVAFGSGSSLDVEGSLVVTTADAIQFDDQGFFSTTEPEAPTVLTVNPSALWFNRAMPSSITNSSVTALDSTSPESFLIGLRAPTERSFLLVGGNINMIGGRITGSGSNIELGGLAEPGVVDLETDANSIRLAFREEHLRSSITLNGNGRVNLLDGGGGSIAAYADRFTATNGSLLFVATEGIENGGSINVEANQIALSGISLDDINSGFLSYVLPSATGDGGAIDVIANSVAISDGAQISSVTFGTGAAGDVEVVADTIDVSGVREDRLDHSAIQSLSERNFEGIPATGAAGDVTVVSRQLSVRDGGKIMTSTFGGGASGGNLSVTVREETELIGSGDLIRGVISSGLTTRTTGATDAGNLLLETGQLSIKEGANIITSTFGVGTAGEIEVVADSINVSGVRADQKALSAIGSVAAGQIFEDIPASAIGRAGTVTVLSRQLSVLDGGQISTSTLNGGVGSDLFLIVQESTELVGSGTLITGATSSGLSTQTQGATDAGNLRLETGRLSIREGALIDASTFGSGAAGNVEVIADSIDVIGVSASQEVVSAIRSVSGQISDDVSAVGDAGDVTVVAQQLSVRDGGRITAETAGGGAGGNLSVIVREVTELVGSGALVTATNGRNSSGVTTQTLGVADAGNLRLETDRLSIREGAAIDASTRGAGAAGTIEVVADVIDIIGKGEDQLASSSIQSLSGRTTEGPPASGSAGDVAITARRLYIEDGVIATLAIGEALAGNIKIIVQDRLEMKGGEVSTTSLQAAGGDIQINIAEGLNSGILVLREDSDITTSSKRDGGSIEIRGSAIIAFDDSDILTTSEDESGGDITLGNFFSARDPFDAAPPIDGNGRVNINAEGRIASGSISTPDVSFIENSLGELSDEIVDTETITAGSCIARNSSGTGVFLITGREASPQLPGSNLITVYPTGTIQPVLQTTATSMLQEPQDVYQTADGRLVLSYECES